MIPYLPEENPKGRLEAIPRLAQKGVAYPAIGEVVPKLVQLNRRVETKHHLIDKAVAVANSTPRELAKGQELDPLLPLPLPLQLPIPAARGKEGEGLSVWAPANISTGTLFLRNSAAKG